MQPDLLTDSNTQKLGQASLFHTTFLASRKKSDGTKILKFLSLPEGSTVLDLGCGTGEITYKLAELVGSRGRVVGVDPDKERLEVARRNNKFTNLTFLEGDSATFLEDQYDLVFCHYVIDLIKDKETLYKRVEKTLKPGGQFASITILQSEPFMRELTGLLGPEDKKEVEGMFFYVSVDKYDELAMTNGFTVKLKEEDADVIIHDSPESVIDLWSAVTHGKFDPSKADQDGLEKFKEKYSGQTIERKLPVVRYILQKH